MHALSALAVSVAVALAGCGGPAAWSAAEPDLNRVPLSAWGSSGKNLWFAGGGLGSAGAGALVMRYDGKAFVDVSPALSSTMWWVFGTSPDSVWFCGEGGDMLHWDGHQIAVVAPALPVAGALYGMWGSSDSDLWAVGGKPDVSSVALHNDGTGWKLAASLPALGGAYFKIWGSARDDVFIVGQGATILHFDGSAWSKMDSGLPQNVSLFTVAGNARDNVYAVGAGGLGGVAIHYDGKTWSPVAGLPDLAGVALAGVAVDAAGDVVMCGAAGVKLRQPAGAAWIDDSRRAPRNTDFHGAWLDGPEDIFIVGGNYTAPKSWPRQGVIATFGK